MTTFNDVEKIFDDANQMVPRKGIYGVHETHIEGLNGFHWAATKIDFHKLLRLYVYLCWGDDEPTAEAVLSLNELVDELESGKISPKEFPDRFNNDLAMGPDWTILWCGLFDDLLTSQDDDPRWVRSGFVEEAGENEPEGYVPPIPRDQVAEFAEYLFEWA